MYNHKNGTVFRKVEQEDLQLLLDLKQESWWGTHSVLFANMRDQQKWFENLGDKLVFSIIRGQVVMGVCVISDVDYISRKASISGSVLKDFRNNNNPRLIFEAGIDFAFEMFNFHRLEAEVLESNYSAQLLEVNMLGFTVEGKKRMAVYKSGRYYDSIVLGLLRNEWEQQARIKLMRGCNTNFDHDKAERLVQRSRKNIQCQNPCTSIESSDSHP
jgi:RimJ/RimL family protein N-acetyltransferase